MSDVLTIIRPSRQADVDTVAKLQAQDNHQVFFPSFVVENGERIIGALNINPVPLVTAWFDTSFCGRMQSRDSIMFYENSLREKAFTHVGIFVGEESPFRPLVERGGYKKVNSLFIKHL